MITYPAIKPGVSIDPHGWFDDRNKEFLKPLISDVKVIVELGAWLGTSTRWFCANSSAKVYSVDHWKGSIEHQGRKDVRDKLPTLYETFIVNCWEYRERIVPIKMNTTAGLAYLHDIGIKPDIIFVDASHEYDDVLSDLTHASKYFPDAILSGDDWSWANKRVERRKTVREAVKSYAKSNKQNIFHNSRCWMIKPKGN